MERKKPPNAFLVALLICTCNKAPLPVSSVEPYTCMWYHHKTNVRTIQTCRHAKPRQLCVVFIENDEARPGGCWPFHECPGANPELDCLKLSDGTTRCCCGSEPDPVTGLYCNDIRNDTNDAVWKHFCSLPNIGQGPYCKQSPAISPYCATGPSNEANVDCKDPNKTFCGIDTRTGALQSCLGASDCPVGSNGRPVVCDGTKQSCCCQDLRDNVDKKKVLACNNIFNPEDDTVRQQACGLPELAQVCGKPPPTTTTEKPELTWENMKPEECRQFCLEEGERRGELGPFMVFCGHSDYNYNPGGSRCQGKCPSACDEYCDDFGTRMQCPKLPKRIQLRETTGKLDGEEMKEDDHSGVIIFVVALVIILVLVGVCLMIWKFYKKRQREQVQVQPGDNQQMTWEQQRQQQMQMKVGGGGMGNQFQTPSETPSTVTSVSSTVTTASEQPPVVVPPKPAPKLQGVVPPKAPAPAKPKV